MRYRYSYLIALLFTLVLAACGGQTASDVSGTWNGTNTVGSPLTLQLTQNGTNLSGTFSVPGEAAIPMNGTVASNLVSLSAQDSSGSLNLEASVNGDSMQGTITLTLTGEQPASTGFTATR